MLQKRFDIDRAIRQLRAEQSPPALTAAAKTALRLPPHKFLFGRWAAITASAAVFVAVLWPRSTEDLAWAHTIRSTLDAPLIHTHSNNIGGKYTMDRWISGRRRAEVMFDSTDNSVVFERRSDGEREILVSRRFVPGRSHRPNARSWGFIYRPSKNSSSFTPASDSVSIERLLSDQSMRVIKHTPAVDDQPEKYQLKWTQFDQDLEVEIDRETQRISRINYKEGSSEIVQYPKLAPPNVFEPRSVHFPDAELYDNNHLGRQIAASARAGLATQGPITLRAALLDAEGGLTVYWTGAAFNGQATSPLRIRGMATLGTKTVMTLVRNPKERLFGIRVVPAKTINKAVDLELSYRGGLAQFRRIPVLRVGSTSHFSASLENRLP